MVAAPAVMPVTNPPEDTEAIPGLPLFHAPPDVASLNEVVKPTHTIVEPLMAAGIGFTVNVIVTLLAPTV